MNYLIDHGPNFGISRVTPFSPLQRWRMKRVLLSTVSLTSMINHAGLLSEGANWWSRDNTMSASFVSHILQNNSRKAVLKMAHDFTTCIFFSILCSTFSIVKVCECFRLLLIINVYVKNKYFRYTLKTVLDEST